MTVYSVFKSNITRVTADAVVYSANTHLIKGSGMCKDVFNAAGEQELTDALEPYGELPEGEALITSGYNLPAKYLIHTVTPIYYTLQDKNVEIFSYCFVNCLKKAAEHKLKNIAFPCIGCGNHGWPVIEAIRIMVDTISWVLARHPEYGIDKIIFVAYDERQEYELKSYLKIKRLM